MRRPLHAALLCLLAGVAACGPVRTEGPTAVVLKVFLNEGRGTRIFFISGTDDTPVNLFPSVYRPEQVSETQLPTGQSVRVLLDDSLGGSVVTFTVVGFSADNTALEQGSVRVTVVAKQEVVETVRLSLYEDAEDGGLGTGGGTANGGGAGGGAATGGGRTDGGARLDGGAADAGPACGCLTGCCDERGECVGAFQTPGEFSMRYVPAGNPKEFCKGLCNPVTSDRWSPALDACGCGSGKACDRGQRCDLSKQQCVCDLASNCQGCCSGTTCLGALANAQHCGAGGLVCDACTSGSTPACVLGVCSGGGCATVDRSKCCSGSGQDEVEFPTCRRLTGTCEACDRARSDRCSADVGLTGSGCGCGLGKSCGINQVCWLVNGGTPECVNMPVFPSVP